MKRFFILLLIPFALVWPQDISVEQERRAEITEDTRQVVVTGLGTNRDEAIKQGLRSAVEQAIGVFLKSETIIENSITIEDQILSHSRGYVESFDIITEGAQADLYTVRLSVVVIVKQLEATLIELQLYTRPVEGESLFAKAYTKISETRDAAQLYKHIRGKYPRNSIKVIFGEPDIKTSTSDLVEVRIPYSFEWHTEYITEVREVLEETCDAIAHSAQEKERLQREYRRDHVPIYIERTDEIIEKESTVHFVRKVLAQELLADLGWLRLSVALLDGDGNTIGSKIVRTSSNLFHVWYTDQYNEYLGGIYYHLDEPRLQRENRRIRYVQFEIPVDDLPKIAAVSGYLFEKGTMFR